MSVAIIELNDAGICCVNDRGDLTVSPGYALLTPEGVATGDAALQRAYLEPQQSFNQYWWQLNLSPLPVTSKQARHYADLAYAQLLALHRDSGHPEQVIFAVPGSFDRGQLSLLLGLVKASPFEATGLVDAAVAAASRIDATGTVAHLDIQLHQAVITRLDVRQQIERTAVEVVSNVGLKAFHDLWTQYIANQFIRQYRYDPLHTAAGEQQLYNRLPAWLSALHKQAEITAELDSPQGHFRLVLSRNELLASGASRLQLLRDKLSDLKAHGETLLLSHRAAQLPGLREDLAPSATLDQNAAINGCLDHLEVITGNPENLHFITRLPARLVAANAVAAINEQDHQPVVTRSNGAADATHVLYRHRAHAIGNRLAITREADQLHFAQGSDGDCCLIHEHGKLALKTQRSTVTVAGDHSDLRAGDSLQIDGDQLDLIEVT
ncbi:hypothetical protein [Porticoccus sp.]|uniref:hypothetical protein n=1 Tax=Porticoccus sp. TaxID=2024853 RepID=UPI003F6A1BB8